MNIDSRDGSSERPEACPTQIMLNSNSPAKPDWDMMRSYFEKVDDDA
jgi:hypothetical protein